MSRALQTLQVAARERETQAWTKAQVAAMTHRLQLAQDCTAFADALLSSLSENFDLLFGVFYLADKHHTRFTRIAAFATDVATEPREYVLGEGLVGQATEERRSLKTMASADKPLKMATGVATVEAACVFFLPVIQQNVAIAVGEWIQQPLRTGDGLELMHRRLLIITLFAWLPWPSFPALGPSLGTAATSPSFMMLRCMSDSSFHFLPSSAVAPLQSRLVLDWPPRCCIICASVMDSLTRTKKRFQIFRLVTRRASASLGNQGSRLRSRLEFAVRCCLRGTRPS